VTMSEKGWLPYSQICRFCRGHIHSKCSKPQTALAPVGLALVCCCGEGEELDRTFGGIVSKADLQRLKQPSPPQETP
jgi:hypothetical protein